MTLVDSILKLLLNYFILVDIIIFFVLFCLRTFLCWPMVFTTGSDLMDFSIYSVGMLYN